LAQYPLQNIRYISVHRTIVKCATIVNIKDRSLKERCEMHSAVPDFCAVQLCATVQSCNFYLFLIIVIW